MKRISLRTWLAGVVLGVALVMTLSCGVSYAENPKGCPKEGDAGTCSGSTITWSPARRRAALAKERIRTGIPRRPPPAAFSSTATPGRPPPASSSTRISRAVEMRARELLQRNLKFREDISPYRGNNKL